jgi:hypothetical protein
MTSVVTGPNIETTIAAMAGAFQIRGLYRGPSTIGTTLNNESTPTFSVFNSTVLGVSLQNPAAQAFQPETVVVKRGSQVIAFEGSIASGAFTFPPQAVNLIVYTEMYAVLGQFRLEAGVSLTNFSEATSTLYIPVVSARIFPLVQARPGLVGGASVVLVSKSAIRSYNRA